MANHPAIDRILKQISSEETKAELTSPENSMEQIMEDEANAAAEKPKPIEDVGAVFSDEVLQETRESIDLIEAEKEKRREEEIKLGEEILKKLEDGADPSEIAPPESEETLGQNPPPDVKEYFDSRKEEYSFQSCFDLRDFFKDYRDEFDEWALPALDSVLQAVDSITSGCKCNLQERRKMVEQYYVTFVTQNQHNSLITKMKEILKTKKLKFFSEEKLFLDV